MGKRLSVIGIGRGESSTARVTKFDCMNIAKYIVLAQPDNPYGWVGGPTWAICAHSNVMHAHDVQTTSTPLL